MLHPLRLSLLTGGAIDRGCVCCHFVNGGLLRDHRATSRTRVQLVPRPGLVYAWNTTEAFTRVKALKAWRLMNGVEVVTP